ncbi:MAG: hypothetical protein EP340_06775 [Alphaproteobacteria bacterium]|nr:MAG: hypothetical protein EP340_06775 [Alphaproteobacteria bacterium]
MAGNSARRSDENELAGLAVFAEPTFPASIAALLAGRAAGYPHAADNLDHFLGNTGATISFDEDWLRSQPEVEQAVWQNEQVLRAMLEVFLIDQSAESDFEYSQKSEAKIDPEQGSDFFYAAGGSTFTSWISAKGKIDPYNNVKVDFEIKHNYKDYYDWEVDLSTDLYPARPGTLVVGDDLGRTAVAAGLASEFSIENSWIVFFHDEFQKPEE